MDWQNLIRLVKLKNTYRYLASKKKKYGGTDAQIMKTLHILPVKLDLILPKAIYTIFTEHKQLKTP